MRPVLMGDVIAAARVLARLPAADRREAAAALVAEAEAADAGAGIRTGRALSEARERGTLRVAR